jgi:hypothetical protein
MMRTALFLMLPLGGLAIALAYGRSFAARVVGVGLAFLAAAAGLGTLFVAHRLVRLTDLHGQAPTDEWLRGVNAMQKGMSRPVLVTFVVVVVLAVIALKPHGAAPRGKD